MSSRNTKKQKKRKNNKMVIPLPRKTLDITIPSHKDITIAWAKLFTLDAANPSQDSYIISNGPAKPDPATSVQPTGWENLVQDLYAFGRALSYRCKITFNALGASPAVVWAYESNQNPSGLTYVDNFGNPYFHSKSLTAITGRGQAVITFSRSLDKIVGATPTEIMTADNYLFVTTYSAGPPVVGYPPDLAYIGFGAQTEDGANLQASKIVGTLEMTWLLRVYDRHIQ
jgi:hypothetical protein